LDIKPQNILLDDRFNAKLSDFGLSKMINRDQSKVMTRMRGTRGYLAPEWLGSKITEKADIYSFGIVVEIICGRENLDESLPEESIHLISLLEEKARSGQLLDLVDSGSNDMQFHLEEVMEAMRVTSQVSTIIKSREGFNYSNFATNKNFLYAYSAPYSVMHLSAFLMCNCHDEC
jgi:serine/threonine protein kinase